MRPKASTVLFAGPAGCPGWFELPTRQPDDRFGKAGNRRDCIIERHGRVLGFADDDRQHPHAAPEQGVERGQRMADGAEVAAGDQNERQLQRHHHIENGALAVERHHDAAGAFDQQNIAPLIDRGLAIFDHRINVDAAAFALGREIGR